MSTSVRSRLGVGLAVIAVVLLVGQSSSAGGGEGGTQGAPETLDLPAGTMPVPVPGIDAVLEAIQQHRVVALGESHNLAEAGRFYDQLGRSDDVASVVDAFVVEFGNARYQRLVDRYVSGGRVSLAELRKVWQDSTQVGAWDAPMYRRFFAAIRAGNAKRDPSQRIRVLLGDPPIDWSRVSSTRDVRWFLLRRERFMARLIVREVLLKGRRAIVIAGLAHLQRSVDPVAHPNVTQILDKRYPGAAWVVGVHLGFPAPEWEQAVTDWPIPSIATLSGTWIGMLSKGNGLAQDALDAMLYLGAPDSLHLSIPLPGVYRDDAYWQTLKDRWPLGVGGPFSAKAVFAAYEDPGYPGLFSQRAIEALRLFAHCMRDHAVEAFPDPQLQYDAVGFYGPAIEEARSDPDYPAAFQACGQLLGGSSQAVSSSR